MILPGAHSLPVDGPCGRPPVAAIAFRRDVVLDRAEVRLGDIADLAALPGPLRKRAANLVIANVERGHRAVAVAALKAGLQARVPMLRCWLPSATPSGARVQIQRVPEVNINATMSVRPAWAAPPAVQAGDMLSLTVATGPVRVERRVEALQSARSGHRLFVRDADGNTLSVAYASNGQ